MGKAERRQKHLDEGWRAIERNDLRRAEELAGVALEKSPGDADFLRILGTTLLLQRRFREALAPLKSAFGNARGKGAGYHLGHCYLALGDPQSAIPVLEREVKAFPDFAEAHNLLGVALAERFRYEEARRVFTSAIERNPRFSEAYNNMGNALIKLERVEDAIPYFTKAIELQSQFAPAHNNLGIAYRRVKRLDEAIACHQRAIALAPDYAEAYTNLGLDYQEADRIQEAIDSYRRAIDIKPDDAEAHASSGTAYQEVGKSEEAIACYERALAIEPDNAESRWLLAMSPIPVVRGATDDLAYFRSAFSRRLSELDQWVDSTRLAEAFKAVGVPTPFYLAYQEEDNRDLLGRHGALCARIMADWYAHQNFAPPKTRNSKEVIRVGVVSRHFQSHSVWNALVKGWFDQLDRERFSLHAFYTGFGEDGETLFAKAHAAHFEQGGRPLQQWVEAIIGRQLDVLVYPEIGMDPITMKLASLRLARVQVAAWGHPETTGLPTIDYYLSAEDLEPASAQDNYTEKLVALPHLGCYYKPPQVIAAPPDLNSLGIDPGSPLLLCPGVPFKYAPQYDHVFTEIARRIGRCQFVFFIHKTHQLSEKLRQRLEVVFAQNQMDISKCVTLIPWQQWAGFYGLLKRADVVLDTIGFSGFNTAVQAVECGAPIVTREGRFLRGRFASGILKRLGLQELVAESEDEYVALAVKLVQDSEYRERVRGRIEASRHLLFEDVEPIRGLEDFLAAVLGSNREATLP